MTKLLSSDVVYLTLTLELVNICYVPLASLKWVFPLLLLISACIQSEAPPLTLSIDDRILIPSISTPLSHSSLPSSKLNTSSVVFRNSIQSANSRSVSTDSLRIIVINQLISFIIDYTPPTTIKEIDHHLHINHPIAWLNLEHHPQKCYSGRNVPNGHTLGMSIEFLLVLNVWSNNCRSEIIGHCHFNSFAPHF